LDLEPYTFLHGKPIEYRFHFYKLVCTYEPLSCIYTMKSNPIKLTSKHKNKYIFRHVTLLKHVGAPEAPEASKSEECSGNSGHR